MTDSMHTPATMMIVTGIGWTISLQEIEVVAKIVSLIVPTVLSVILFVRNEKNRKNNGKG